MCVSLTPTPTCCPHHDDAYDDDAYNDDAYNDDADCDDAEHTVRDISLCDTEPPVVHITSYDICPLCLSHRLELLLTVPFLRISKVKSIHKMPPDFETQKKPLSLICCNFVMMV